MGLAHSPTLIRNRDGSTTILDFRFGHGERLRLASRAEVPPEVARMATGVAVAAKEAEYRRAAARVSHLGGDDFAASLFRRDAAEADEVFWIAVGHCRAAIDAWDRFAVVQASGRLIWISESDPRLLNVIRVDGMTVCGACVGVGIAAGDDGPVACDACGGRGLESTFVPACVKAALERLRERRERRAAVVLPASASEPSRECVAAVADAAEPDIEF